jgi:hypothetical protein
MELTDQNKNTSQIAGRLESTSVGAQIKALNQLLQKPLFAIKRAPSENMEQQLTIEINSLAAENQQLAKDLEKVKKELGKYRALVGNVHEESKAAIADIRENLEQLQAENKKLKSELDGVRVLLRIPLLKLKIICAR